MKIVYILYHNIMNIYDEISSIIRKLKYRLKKILLYPKEQIIFFFTKNFSKIFFLSDHANWATDRTTGSIYKIARSCGFRCKKTINHPRNQFVFYGDQYSLFAKNIFRLNNIISFDYQHGIPKFSKTNKKLLELIIKNQRNIHLIRVTNSFFKKLLIKYGISESKIIQIPLTVNNIFKKYKKNKCKEFKKKYGLPNDKFIIGSFHKDGDGFGHGFSPKYIKGPDIFLKTLKSLQPSIKNLFVLLTAPARGYVIEGLQNLGIEFKHIKNLRFSDLPELYNCLDVYLISSRDEGGPTGMFEAMACGVPVVTTKVGLVFDSIFNGKNGFCAELNDFEKLAEYIKIINNNNYLKRKIINQSLIEAKKHTEEKHKILWKKFFTKLQEFKNI